MSTSVKMERIGESLDAKMSAEDAERLGLVEGAVFITTRTPDGIQFHPHDPKLAAAMEAAREFMVTHDETMKELAK